MHSINAKYLFSALWSILVYGTMIYWSLSKPWTTLTAYLRVCIINGMPGSRDDYMISTTLYERVKPFSKLTNHYFNPAIGELINLWGFHTDDYPITSPPPTTEAIKELAEQQLSVNNLQLSGLTLSSDNPHIWLDFGGIAKGLAVDQAIAIIQDYGIENAIVNAGGDLRSIGQRGDRAWRIGIQSPDNQDVLAELQIDKDEAVFTSGNYQRYKAFDGKRYAHIIDGRTGLPVQDIISATVITDDGITALLINSQNQCLTTDAMYQRLKNLAGTCEIISF